MKYRKVSFLKSRKVTLHIHVIASTGLGLSCEAKLGFMVRELRRSHYPPH